MAPGSTILPVLPGWFTSPATVCAPSMLEVLDTEFVKLARAKGVAEAMVVWKHALRNALIRCDIGLMFDRHCLHPGNGFVWPVLAVCVWALWPATSQSFKAVLIWSGIIIFLNLLVDLAYGVLDPRIRS